MTDVQNVTKLANDPLDANEKDFHDRILQTYLIIGYMDYVTENVRVMINLLSVAANVFIIVIMKKSNKFTSKTDRLIFHYAVWHTIYSFSYDLIEDFLGVTGLYIHVPFVVYMILFEIAKSGLYLVYFFSLGLGIDWLLNIHNFKLGERCSRFNENLLYVMYGMGIFLSIIVFISLWFSYIYWKIKSITSKTIYYSIFFIILVLNKLERTNESASNKQSYNLTVANIIIFPWMPLYIYQQLLSFTYGHFILHSVVLYTIFLPQWICSCNSIVIFMILFNLNKYFELGFWGLFKRRAKNYVVDTEKLVENEEDNNQESRTVPSDQIYL
ncbi:uncharacterized protein LOC130896272 isoform X1 [Diorhabda carinulata]|uniref:uncharacterized protein LOC130896272 isoform X1 n=1 Tax=Diorhabda carinulata TaxID=1163345 RepID=UPI0025A08C00|nr:uncharacterized protein LOC130896272 isoform X1 [Diorhabda carinulata]